MKRLGRVLVNVGHSTEYGGRLGWIVDQPPVMFARTRPGDAAVLLDHDTVVLAFALTSIKAADEDGAAWLAARRLELGGQ